MNLTVHEAQQEVVIPRGALIAAGMAITVAIGAAMLGGNPTTPAPTARLEATRTLSFADAPDGAVLVTDANSGAPVARLAPGSNGFIRSTLRAMAHEGHAAHASAVHPFILSAYADGRIILDDPGTGEKLDLEAFGSLNAGAFAALLTAGAGGAK